MKVKLNLPFSQILSLCLIILFFVAIIPFVVFFFCFVFMTRNEGVIQSVIYIYTFLYASTLPFTAPSTFKYCYICTSEVMYSYCIYEVGLVVLGHPYFYLLEREISWGYI